MRKRIVELEAELKEVREMLTRSVCDYQTRATWPHGSVPHILRERVKQLMETRTAAQREASRLVVLVQDLQVLINNPRTSIHFEFQELEALLEIYRKFFPRKG